MKTIWRMISLKHLPVKIFPQLAITARRAMSSTQRVSGQRMNGLGLTSNAQALVTAHGPLSVPKS